MSKGRPGIARPNSPPSPFPLPAIRPRSRSPPALRVPLQPPGAVPLFSPRGSPGALTAFAPCPLAAPSPITHVSTFSHHHAAPRPALIPSLALRLLPPT